MAIRNPRDRLYDLLPALYRQGEERSGQFPLRDLLRLVTDQADIIHADVQQLWNNFFVDTTDRWAIPYIGDLVGNNLLHDGFRARTADTAGVLFDDLSGRQLGAGLDLLPAIAIRTRADVAKTIYYRRRKGTVPMLEELARDVTGWAAHAVEFFELLEWMQNMNHLRDASLECPDVRSIEPLDRLNRAFDQMSHSADVRPIGQNEGWYNIRNIGFFLWRLRSFPLVNVRARPGAKSWQYHFSPLGNRAPLFCHGRREEDEVRVANELDIAGPIRKTAFYEDLASYEALPLPRPTETDYYGYGRSFAIMTDQGPVDAANIICRNLGTWTQPSAQSVAVDVVNGRIAFGTAPQWVDVDFCYGFSAALGGGPYDRSKWLVRPDLATLRYTVGENGVAADFATLGGALAAWVAANRPNTIIAIADNRTYTEATDPDPWKIELDDDSWLVIEAANGVRPHIQPKEGELTVEGDHPGSELTLSGLLIEGAVHVKGDLARLRILHTTLVPGRSVSEQGGPVTTPPSLIADPKHPPRLINTKLRVQIAYTITGPIRLPEHADGLWMLDSIVDGLNRGPGTTKGTAIAGNLDYLPAPPATLERTTVLGSSHFRAIATASEVVFTDLVDVAERQEGCVRFSFVPRGSVTPRRYRCQPDTEIDAQIDEAEKAAGFGGLSLAQQAQIRADIRAAVYRWLVPTFTRLGYGRPAYAQLRLSSPVQVRTGAEDGSEMGAFCHLKQPQRETNLRIRLDEYLPFGLDAGLIYVT